MICQLPRRRQPGYRFAHPGYGQIVARMSARDIGGSVHLSGLRRDGDDDIALGLAHHAEMSADNPYLGAPRVGPARDACFDRLDAPYR